MELLTNPLTYVAILIFLVLFILLVTFIFQKKFVYVVNFPADSRKTCYRPSQFGLGKYEETFILTSDAQRLHSFWIPTNSGNPLVATTVIFFHANAGNMGHRLPIAKKLIQQTEGKINILMISYRGYSQSTGSPDEAGLKEDAISAYDWLRENKKVTGKIVAYGQSLGGAVAIYLASEKPLDGVILENTFLSIPKLVPHLMPPLSLFTGFCSEIWDSESTLRYITSQKSSSFNNMKWLLLAGKNDEMIPITHMRTLYSLLPKDQTTWIENNGKHNDTFMENGYFEVISEFLNKI